MKRKDYPAVKRDYTPGFFKEEAAEFLKNCLDERTYSAIMNSGDGRSHLYVAARIYLGAEDWEKYVYIEKFGSLDGYEEGMAT